MGTGRRRRSFSDSSGSESESESSSEGDEEGRQSNSGSDQDADNWVLCDRCTKWRRIPAAFVDQIREDTPWYCENNPNKAFASCSVPQELTNEEIDAEGDSDGAGESDHDEESMKRRRIPAVWQLLKDNILAHRKRKVQDEDDIMICHCKPTWRGGDGCGPDCINRMLCIECMPGFCPSEDRCTNQMFSKRMYAKLEIRRAGAKGFGLFALEDIKAGQFIIEYIGEVLEEDEYQRRKEYYMSVGQRHYYFMNIGNGEVIDACRKGNISRFINHSCEPNCETQKWLVRGELAIGLFAVRDIPKDTELTFDYNFERYGDKPMRCYCRSTNCRKFIGGMQDNFDVSLLPAVEPDDASHDLPPVMLTDSDMDPNMRMLLEWRIGTKVDKAKEMGMVTRLERVCEARNVTWSVKHFYGQEPLPSAQPHRQRPPQDDQQHPQRPQPDGSAPTLAPAPSSSGQGSLTDKRAGAEVTEAGPAPARAKPQQQQQRKPDKASAGAAAVAPSSKVGKASGTSSGKQTEAGAGLSKLRLEDGGGGGTPATGGGQAAARQAPSTTPEVAQVRGPKALFKQWKIMQQQDPTPAPAVEEKPAATPSSPPSPRSQHSPPSPQSPTSPRSSLSLDNDDAALDEVRNAAAEAAKHVPLRKRLRRLPPKSIPAPATAPEAVTATENGGAAPVAGTVPHQTASVGAAAKRGEGSGTGSSAAPATPAAQVSSSAGAVARKNSLGSGGAPPASAAAGLSYSPPRSTSPPPPSTTGRAGGAGGGSAAANRKLRSEIDRRLDEVVGNHGRLKDGSRQSVIKVLRLFNLCDIGSGHAGRGGSANGFGSAAGGRYLNGGGRNGDDLGGMPGPGPGSSAGGGLTARQRARMADLSLLLDVVIKTTSSAAKKELVACGLLTQLHQAMARNTGKEYCVILRKVLRAVEGLPLEANDVYAVRTAHGNFADMLRQLSSNADYDVRTKAAALLKKFPPSAVTDQRLLQLMSAPPVRFGRGGGGGGGGSMRGGGQFSSAAAGGGMMLLAMQQQMMQQQLLKQQQMMMMRSKDAGVGGSGGLPPPPPLAPGGAAAAAGDAAGAGDAAAAGTGSLARTSSMTSLEDDLMDADATVLAGQNGPTGLPPLGPGRQRAMVAAAAAAALASRPGLLRPMMGRGGNLGMPGPVANGVGAMGAMGAGGLGRGNSTMGSLAMGPSPLGLPPRPPSPASMDLYSAYNGTGSAAPGDDTTPYNSSKRRKFSHPHGQESPAAGDGGGVSPFTAGASLPGPPPRPPYSLVSGGHHHFSHHSHSLTPHRRGSSHNAGDVADAGDRDHAGGSSADLPGPPPRLGGSHYAQHHHGLGRRGGSEERDRDPAADLPERITAEQLFALQRPMGRPTPLPPLQGQLQPERHVHGQLTDAVTLFALGLYGSYGRANPAAAPPPEGKGPTTADSDVPSATQDDVSGACSWSPIVSPAGPPMSPILEPPPPPVPTSAGAASSLELPLPPPPPPPSGGAAGAPWEGAQLRPLRTQPVGGGAAGAVCGPSPYHQHSSPAQYGGWDAAPGAAGAGHGLGSTTSTPTVSGFGSVPQQGGAGGFHPPSSAPGSATAAAATGGTAGLPPVVPISSLSDWRLPPSAAAAAGGPGQDVAAAGGAAVPALARVSPHPSPEPHLGAGAQAAMTGRGGAAPHASAGAGYGGDAENIDEWLRPVSTHHADVWEEPDASFEAYVADMVRHRLGKYMQPEHPSRVSVQEANMLRAKVYREVVAKERRAWEERRSAGVFKPIERHKLEANLKEFVRSTIKRMRDREKEKAAAAAAAGGGAHGQAHQQQQHHQQQHGQHHSQLHRQSLPSAAAHHGQTPPPQQQQQRAQPLVDAAATPPPQQQPQPSGFGTLRLSPSPAPDAATEAGRPDAAGGGAGGSSSGEIRPGEERPSEVLACDEGAQVPPRHGAPASTGGCGGAAGTGDVAMTEAAAA
ncbi:hypothetical protein PLESTB_001053200 [Pleodorina starrii]|uniref:Uncharacterized protein n=1 Tax=Pleodorina starrii TaxID=330485 RepID=A0A9W6F536_9CHLO|nr:hypothetical protein PLESTB_001053200 [Pleodorina starrii]